MQEKQGPLVNATMENNNNEVVVWESPIWDRVQTLSPDTQIEHVLEWIKSSSTIPGSFLEDGQQQNESMTAMANILDWLNDVDLTKDACALESNSELHESTGFNGIKEKVTDQDTLATVQQTASWLVTLQ